MASVGAPLPLLCGWLGGLANANSLGFCLVHAVASWAITFDVWLEWHATPNSCPCLGPHWENLLLEFFVVSRAVLASSV